ncbi:hypothetical protein CXF72_14910 [Psychromonas sp. MB-3u-54]|uniref:glycosyltransferase n=1 Tax=Psychromonas sp. MB-3u-54 TaxID=2058319 RepID=UPI000C3210CB|nr:glycosyltransferase [Psychromonas sp. MB-3u-54]PKH01847.1 hypothetical protein CXF72_14910 [Psychromonas sp. MB-3u-54]
MKNNVAVLLSYYNGGNYIEEQLTSLNEQVGVSCDVYIRDDGSSNNNDIDKLTDLCDKYHNVKIIKGKNVGVVGSFYSLLKIVDHYEYYFFCDQDDYWYENKITNAVARLKNHSDAALYCSSYDLVDDKLDSLGSASPKPTASFYNAIFKNFCTGCTCAINNKLRHELLNDYYNEDIPMHDWWFLLVAYIKGSVIYDELPSIKYRQHALNVVGGTDSVAYKAKRFVTHLTKNNDVRSRMMRDLVKSSHGVTSEYVNEIKKILNSQNSFALRLKIIKAHKFSYTSKLDLLSIYLIILLGKY